VSEPGGKSIRPLVFVVDDEPLMAKAVCAMLGAAGYEARSFGRVVDALARLGCDRPEAVLMDLMMPEVDGIEGLRRIRAMQPDLPVLMVSGQGTIRTAVEALKLGAYDFLEKPVDSSRVQTAMAHALESARLKRQVSVLQGELGERYRMVGDSAALAKVRDLIERAAPTTASVLITGESGVGKELVARAVHFQSRRAAEPFVALNCAAIPKELIESELFGHERGAFTGADRSREGKLEQADRGTLFLDEVADMCTAAQAKLLRFLESPEIQHLGSNECVSLDVRVMAATNRNLAELIKAGSFREDLYHRLNVVAIRVPALRERSEDIEALVQFFLLHFCRRHNRSVTLAEECWPVLVACDWPGNVRELRNLVERVVVLSRTNPVEPGELRDFVGNDEARSPNDESPGALKSALDRAEREAVQKALAVCEGNVTAAARMLGVERPSLYRIMKRHGLGDTGSKP
jgi:two-component system nitrogen regulation response regulator NtrX